MILGGERLVFYFQYITQEIGFMILFNNGYLFLIPVADFVLLESINKISCFLIKRKHTSSWTATQQTRNRIHTTLLQKKTFLNTCTIKMQYDFQCTKINQHNSLVLQEHEINNNSENLLTRQIIKIDENTSFNQVSLKTFANVCML